MFQTEYEFTLPKGYQDENQAMHREGVMRLATAMDEINALRDARVRENPDYAPIIILSGVITRLGDLQEVTPQIIEKLFIGDLNFLQNMYQTINEAEVPVIHVQCPYCGKEFQDTVNFSKME